MALWGFKSNAIILFTAYRLRTLWLSDQQPTLSYGILLRPLVSAFQWFQRQSKVFGVWWLMVRYHGRPCQKMASAHANRRPSRCRCKLSAFNHESKTYGWATPRRTLDAGDRRIAKYRAPGLFTTAIYLRSDNKVDIIIHLTFVFQISITTLFTIYSIALSKNFTCWSSRITENL